MSVSKGPGAGGPGVLGGCGLASTRESLGSCLNNIWWVNSLSLEEFRPVPGRGPNGAITLLIP